MKRETGKFIQQLEGYTAFIPNDLPPTPDIDLDNERPIRKIVDIEKFTTDNKVNEQIVRIEQDGHDLDYSEKNRNHSNRMKAFK